MKKKYFYFILIFIFSFTISCSTQISSILKKTYGFEREVAGGAKENNLSNNNIETNRNSFQYIIFQEYSSKQEIEIENIWIKKIPYEFKIEKTTTPFILNEKELVAQTKNTVIKVLILDKKDTNVSNPSLQKIINENELVIDGQIGNKNFIRAMQKFSKLPTLHTE